MKNSPFNTHDVKQRCEGKLDIAFNGSHEFNGWFMLNDKKAAGITFPQGRKFIPPKTY